MAEKVLKYSEVLEEVQKSPNNILLLGNGFSIAYNAKRFSFTHLKESAIQEGIIAKDSPILKLFEKFNTSDFEKIIRLLNDYVKIDKILNPQKDNQQLKNEIEELKKHLVDTITNNHPDTIGALTPQEYESACTFLKPYNRIYTLNYDLLLYWVTMKLLDKKKNEDFPLEIMDGFNEPGTRGELFVSYENKGRTKCGIFYLHGALHIFDKRDDIIKLTYSRTSIPLKQQIKENLDQEIYPIFISEGQSSEKKEKIIHNAYLNHNFRSLQSVGGNLVIFGTLLKMNDEHIQDAICNNQCENIYIGLFDEDKDPTTLLPFITKLKASPVHKGKKVINRNVFFFDSKSADVWGHNILLNTDIEDKNNV